MYSERANYTRLASTSDVEDRHSELGCSVIRYPFTSGSVFVACMALRLWRSHSKEFTENHKHCKKMTTHFNPIFAVDGCFS